MIDVVMTDSEEVRRHLHRVSTGLPVRVASGSVDGGSSARTGDDQPREEELLRQEPRYRTPV